MNGGAAKQLKSRKPGISSRKQLDKYCVTRVWEYVKFYFGAAIKALNMRMRWKHFHQTMCYV